MEKQTNKTTDEAQIRGLIESRINAVREKDTNGALLDHSSDVLMFDVVNPLYYVGSDKVKERVKEWFSMYQSPIGYDPRDLSVTIGDDVAFCHYLYRVTGTRKDGVNVDMWVRATVCFRKIDGRWMVKHEHDSVPFDPETGKASLDLKP